MEDKKLLKNEDLEKVNGGLGNHEFEFGKDNLAMENKEELLQVTGGLDVPRAEIRGSGENGFEPAGGLEWHWLG